MESVNKILIFTDKQGTIFKDLKESIFKSLETEEQGIDIIIQVYLLRNGQLPSYYDTHSQLNDFFKIFAFVKDYQQFISIAAAEARHYPIFSLAFHPENAAFEFKSQSKHNYESIQFGRNLINQFTQIAGENNHRLQSIEQYFVCINIRPQIGRINYVIEQELQIYIHFKNYYTTINLMNHHILIEF
ncbi:unnamed protein product [Paramecium octaurelia]|uniref:Uncharacterized protein n=1 Tax=Paramecium octaurelia TaxID=43137 RepID=A0A8S1S8P8_PAROT|nr:unnamed protein product [Paramecium octaurelia]